MQKQFLALVFPLLLSACGFHLRGMVDVPEWLNNVAIIIKNNDQQLDNILKSQLEGYHIQVNSDPAQAHYWLIINQNEFRRQIISVGASTNPRQYNLILLIEFMLQTQKGQIIKAPKQIHITRQVTINNDRILGSNDEEIILLGEMKRDAVIQIINLLAHQVSGDPHLHAN